MPSSDPTRQFEWEIASMFETKNLPHQTCMAIHVVPNVHGLLRSELMIIAGLMLERMRRRRFQDQEVFPVFSPCTSRTMCVLTDYFTQLMIVSIIGRDARIIQAHMCSQDQRLKVRCSQLFDFTYYSPGQRDLFLRWLLSDPIIDSKPTADGAKQSVGPTDDTTSPATVFKPEGSPLASSCGDDLQDEVVRMSLGVMVPVA